MRNRDISVFSLFPPFSCGHPVILAESCRKMFYGRIAELDGNIGDRMGGILQQQPGCRHFGFKFFLEKCLSVMLLKQALRLPLT